MTHKYKIGDCFISNDIFDEDRVPMWVVSVQPGNGYVLEGTYTGGSISLFTNESTLDNEYDRRSDYDRPN